MTSEIVDSYLTMASEGTHEIKIKGSRFIALGYPIETAVEAAGILDRIRKREFAATHHCYAWTVGIEEGQFKYSDDGEPSGTAGRPIYRAITGRNLRNVMVVVVRYFGGTKLGTGGLTRAYAQAAADLLDKAKVVERLLCQRLRFSVPFTLYDRLLRLISAGGYGIEAQDFAEGVTMTVDVRKSRADLFLTQLAELTGGQIDIIRLD
jgi:uncharacterized YigZ family protein